MKKDRRKNTLLRNKGIWILMGIFELGFIVLIVWLLGTSARKRQELNMVERKLAQYANEASVESAESMETSAESKKSTETSIESEKSTEVSSEEMIPAPDMSGFYILPIQEDSELYERIAGKSYKEEKSIPLEDLRYLHILHVNGEGETCEGELICNQYIAEDLLDVFVKLYDQQYPIEKVQLVDTYDADDENSMADNNTSCFNDRNVSGSNKKSKHALGLAIDLNPLYNPYIHKVNGKETVEPANGDRYADREGEFPYKIDENDLAYYFFTMQGFEWGGNWKSVKDYQHFEVPTGTVKQLYPDLYQ